MTGNYNAVICKVCEEGLITEDWVVNHNGDLICRWCAAELAKLYVEHTHIAKKKN